MPKINVNVSRVNMNLPTKIVEEVKEYAEELGLPVTQAYTMLLNQALEQKDLIKNMPKILNTINELKVVADDIKSNQGNGVM